MNFLQFLGFIEDMVLSLVGSIFLYIVFEMPARTLERLILSPTTTNRQSREKLDERNEEKI